MLPPCFSEPRRYNRPVNAFAKFVSENYGPLKAQHPGRAHKEIMGIMSKMYAEHKQRLL